MGTSSDYTGGTGGNWTPYKHAASNYARRGGQGRADKVLALYVGALGGAGAAAASGRASGVRAGQGIGGLGAGLATVGLTAALEQLGLGHLVGGDRFDVLDGLVEELAGEGGTREDQAVEAAIVEAFRELYPEDAQTYEELEAVSLDDDDVVRFIERFVGAWAYRRLLPTLAEKFSHIEDPAVAEQRYKELRARLDALVKLGLGERSALNVAWRDDEGEAVLTTVIDQLYEDMEDLGVTDIQLRTAASQADNGADILLDWFDRKAPSTIRYDAKFLTDLFPSRVALDLFRIGGTVFCVDKKVQRNATDDLWTRDLNVQVPVSDPALWDAAKSELVAALSFLSGDRWDLSFVADTEEPAEQLWINDAPNAVSLFSGGLDSLAGVIELLEAGQRLILIGHYDSSFTANKQKVLCTALQKSYGTDRVSLRHLYLRPAQHRATQSRSLPAGIENTTRARSFLFFSAGIAVADALGADHPLYVPENGFIGVNVPLTPARAGSLSTRTTHPLYMHRMGAVLDAVGLTHPIENPYRLLTKGQALEANANQKLLRKLAPESVSCSHPEACRWAAKPMGNCGYCYPCLIRRASLHHIGADRAKDYAWNALTDADLLVRSHKRGRSLRALTASLSQSTQPEDVLLNGRIPNGEARAFYDVYLKGRDELRVWLDGAAAHLRKRLR